MTDGSELSSLADRRRIRELEGRVAELEKQAELRERWLAAYRGSSYRALVDRLYQIDAAELTITELPEHGYRVFVSSRVDAQVSSDHC